MTVKGDLTRKAEKELMQLDNTELRYQEEFSFPNTLNVSKAALLSLLVVTLLTLLEEPLSL